MKRTILSITLILAFVASSVAQSASAVLDKCLGAVVTVAVYKTEPYGKMTLGMRGSVSEDAYKKALDITNAKGSGSGFIIKRNGKYYVVTNAHVIESASTETESIFVYTINQTKYEVKVLGGDNFYDMAVLEFVTPVGKEVEVLEFTKTEPNVGDKVYAIGNPLGTYPYTVTDGIISAKNRTRGGHTGKFGFLQHTATLIWGNSGGPLVNEKGEVVGINSQIAFAQAPDGSQILQQQINFSLEPGLSNRLVNEVLNNNGRIKRAYLGVEVAQAYLLENKSYYLQDETAKIYSVIPGSPAYSSLKSKVGYSIRKVGGIEVRNVEEVLGEFEKIAPEATVSLEIVSPNGVSETVSFKTATLNKFELENIASYVLTQIPGVTLNTSYGQVAFDYTDQSNYQVQKEKKFTNERGDSRGRTYYVICGGIYNESNPNMWKIITLKDLGAAIKMSSLSGVFDYYIIDAADTKGKASLYRQYLSGKNDLIKSTIYY
ncbi:MAG: trypsin-like peptidase domain-containing protein [Flavobacteriales bacterium]|nr:trypsin-like peptidase domain-containing protein [Flavobacteriales bacterium]